MEREIMAYEELKSSGITAKTPENIMLGAGTIHKGLALTDGKWNFEESLIGATSGGSKFSIVPEYTDIEVDGALVKVKGFTVKTGETATMEVNFLEMTPDLLKMCVVGDVAASTDYEGYTEITSRARVEEGDYIENLAYVGKKTDGTPIIIIFAQAICTSGLEVEGKNKEAGVFKGTFECVADVTPEADTLPWKILYPTPQA
jgi:hypothetical protein